MGGHGKKLYSSRKFKIVSNECDKIWKKATKKLTRGPFSRAYSLANFTACFTARAFMPSTYINISLDILVT